ncbi:MAG: hypothetical protein NT080_05010 [Spirochaetes bacterium]|nr:hypothetical protein [Spirochaetota bacterium]
MKLAARCLAFGLSFLPIFPVLSFEPVSVTATGIDEEEPFILPDVSWGFGRASWSFYSILEGDGDADGRFRLASPLGSVFGRLTGKAAAGGYPAPDDVRAGFSSPTITAGPVEPVGVERFLASPASTSRYFDADAKRPFDPDPSCEAPRYGVVLGADAGIFAVGRRGTDPSSVAAERVGAWYSAPWSGGRFEVLVERAGWEGSGFDSWLEERLPPPGPALAGAAVLRREGHFFEAALAAGGLVPFRGEPACGLRMEGALDAGAFRANATAGLCGPAWYGTESVPCPCYGYSIEAGIDRDGWGISLAAAASDEPGNLPERSCLLGGSLETGLLSLDAGGGWNEGQWSVSCSTLASFGSQPRAAEFGIAAERDWTPGERPGLKLSAVASAGIPQASTACGFGASARYSVSSGEETLLSARFSVRRGSERMLVTAGISLSDFDLDGAAGFGEKLEFHLACSLRCD